MSHPMFRSHLLNPKGLELAQGIADAFDRLLIELPAGEHRCMALVRTHLETACFFAKKAIAVMPEHQLEPIQPEPKPTPRY